MQGATHMTDVTTTAQIVDGLAEAESAPVVHRVQATVTAVSATTGTLTAQWASGTTTAGIAYLSSYSPKIADTIWLLECGGDYLALDAQAAPAGAGLTGTIDYTYSSSAPAGWLFANGGAIASQYTALIALVGANTPDLRNRFIIGAGSTYSVGGTGGSATSTDLIAHNHTQNSHNHTQDAHSHTQQLGNGGGGSTSVQIVGSLNYPASAGSTANTTATNQAATATNQSAGSGSSFSILNPYYALNPIIKT